MSERIKALRELAEKATPGPWFASDWNKDDGPNRTTIERREPEVVHPGQSRIWPDGVRCVKLADTEEGESPLPDAAYIAAASPDYVLKLLEVVQRAKYVARSNGFDAALPEKMDALRSSLEALERA